MSLAKEAAEKTAATAKYLRQYKKTGNPELVPKIMKRLESSTKRIASQPVPEGRGGTMTKAHLLESQLTRARPLVQAGTARGKENYGFAARLKGGLQAVPPTVRMLRAARSIR